MLYRKIDDNGCFIEDVLLQNNEEVTEDLIKTECSQGFYLPKWNGIEWVEGGTKPLESVESQIAQLKLELEETDYQIIKCSEYQLLDLEMPYDLQALHTSRQAIRDRINELKTLI